MKIAVFGYYHALNAGDDRIQYCLTRLLQGHTVVFLPHYLPPPRAYLQTFDWILIGGGGLVFEKVGIWSQVKDWLKHCKAKIGVLGLGVNQVTPDLWSEVVQLIDRSTFFYVRDQPSKALLNHHPKVEVYPDLTWCYPLRSQRSSPGTGIALNLLPCHWKDYDPQAWVQELADRTVHPFPFHFGRQRDFDLLNGFFPDMVPSEFSLQPLIKSETLVACRFHAIVFAMQLGKPFVAINYDDKVKRLLNESHLTDFCLETTEYGLLNQKLSDISRDRDRILTQIQQFASDNQQQAQQLITSVQSHLASDQSKNPGQASLFRRVTHRLKF